MGQPQNCNNCPGGHQQGSAQSDQGIESTSTVEGEDMDVSAALASIFAPGSLDQSDALLLWTGVNTVLFASLVYLEVRRDG